jgi:hypothetical protein
MENYAPTYKVITDEAILMDFIQNVLPDHEEHEQFYCCLFARKKYAKEVPWIKSDKSQLKRFTSTKEKLLTKIRQLECPIGAYAYKEGPMPQESLALYISPNPRDLWRATVKGIGKLALMIEATNKNANPHQEIMSVIQQTKSRTIWVTFDIDEKTPAVLDRVDAALGGCKSCRRVLETRGGYHVLVEPSKVPASVKNTWHKNIATMADVTGDSLIPVPGTYQGGFTPHFI